VHGYARRNSVEGLARSTACRAAGQIGESGPPRSTDVRKGSRYGTTKTMFVRFGKASARPAGGSPKVHLAQVRPADHRSQAVVRQALLIRLRQAVVCQALLIRLRQAVVRQEVHVCRI